MSECQGTRLKLQSLTEKKETSLGKSEARGSTKDLKDEEVQ